MKINFIFDKTIKAQLLKKNLLKKYRNCNLNISEAIVVGGGDGFMLSTMKKLYKYNLPFYGINCGTFGFLMNKFSTQNLERRIIKSISITINPLEIKTTNINGKIKKLFAINEVSLFRQSKQTSLIRLKIGKKIIIKKLIGDGVLVATPAGTTAYNLSVHGPILPLDSKKIAITPISPFRPRRWSGKTISNNNKISLLNLDFKKRPLAAVADNIEIRNIKNLVIKLNKKIKFKLMYDSRSSLKKRNLLERIKKNYS